MIAKHYCNGKCFRYPVSGGTSCKRSNFWRWFLGDFIRIKVRRWKNVATEQKLQLKYRLEWSSQQYEQCQGWKVEEQKVNAEKLKL